MTATALEITDLYKTYPGNVSALSGINLSIQRGDFFALLGANGAGKSTTIGIIAGLVNKTSGQVSVLGDDLDRSPHLVKSHIGLVPQEFNFHPFEPVEQIIVNQAGYYGVSRKLALARCETYLKQLGLWHKRHESALKLSGGMKRRLMIARALTHEPEVLILDEPTAGVDIELRRSMWQFLQTLNADGRTIILTTHYLEEAESLCRNVAIINQGKIVENTSIANLLSRLNQQTIIFDTEKPMMEVNLPGFHYDIIDEGSIAVTIAGEQRLNTLFDLFQQQAIQIRSMRNKTNRLEELFLQRITHE